MSGEVQEEEDWNGSPRCARWVFRPRISPFSSRRWRCQELINSPLSQAAPQRPLSLLPCLLLPCLLLLLLLQHRRSHQLHPRRPFQPHPDRFPACSVPQQCLCSSLMVLRPTTSPSALLLVHIRRAGLSSVVPWPSWASSPRAAEQEEETLTPLQTLPSEGLRRLR